MEREITIPQALVVAGYAHGLSMFQTEVKLDKLARTRSAND
jgi:hypothetical protein